MWLASVEGSKRGFLWWDDNQSDAEEYYNWDDVEITWIKLEGIVAKFEVYGCFYCDPDRNVLDVFFHF